MPPLLITITYLRTLCSSKIWRLFFFFFNGWLKQIKNKSLTWYSQQTYLFVKYTVVSFLLDLDDQTSLKSAVCCPQFVGGKLSCEWAKCVSDAGVGGKQKNIVVKDNKSLSATEKSQVCVLQRPGRRMFLLNCLFMSQRKNKSPPHCLTFMAYNPRVIVCNICVIRGQRI